MQVHKRQGPQHVWYHVLGCIDIILVCVGIGGDAFCLYFDAKTKKVSALLGNGGAPGALTLEVRTSLSLW